MWKLIALSFQIHLCKSLSVGIAPRHPSQSDVCIPRIIKLCTLSPGANLTPGDESVCHRSQYQQSMSHYVLVGTAHY